MLIRYIRYRVHKPLSAHILTTTDLHTTYIIPKPSDTCQPSTKFIGRREFQKGQPPSIMSPTALPHHLHPQIANHHHHHHNNHHNLQLYAHNNHNNHVNPQHIAHKYLPALTSSPFCPSSESSHFFPKMPQQHHYLSPVLRSPIFRGKGQDILILLYHAHLLPILTLHQLLTSFHSPYPTST